jgi:hypothetical protein
MPDDALPGEFWMRRGYQKEDAQFIDYELYQLPGVRGVFRGPPIVSDQYLVCIGAAQTFGRFVQTPYPRLISQILGMDALNLGRGGAGPTFPLSNPILLERINRAQVVIVQVLSGRSQSNSLFRIENHGMNGVRCTDGSNLSADEFWTQLLTQDKEAVARTVAETRSNYVVAMTELLDAIKPPKILFWFSVRTPEYTEALELPLHRLWGDFPHLVNLEMVERLRNHCDAYVECISRRGLPQILAAQCHVKGAFTVPSPSNPNEPLRIENRYYPSPEMHQDATAVLVPACRQLLSDSPQYLSFPVPVD